MGRSLGLAAYRALSHRSGDRRFAPSTQRPIGELLWIHAAEPENLLSIQDLAQRLSSSRHGLHVLITLPDQESFDAARNNWVPHDDIYLELVPSENPDAVAAFWAHWAPDMALWTWGKLRPNLVYQAHRKKCPIALIDADTQGFDNRRDRWLPDLSGQLLAPFIALMARTSATVQKLGALGLPTGRIEVTAPMKPGGQVLPCKDSDLADFSEMLKARPVWLASNIQDDEVLPVLEAHRHALRLSHRLLLILHPAHPGLTETFSDRAWADGFRIADWEAGDVLDDTTQVLMASDHRDLGLFYRVAPVCFMGSSLVPGFGGRNPFEAAALGSAVLYGPNVRRFMPFYSRLAKAGAARIVKDGETMGAAITRLISPDQAAAMAHAGWDVVSQGAELTDRVIDLVNAAMDGEMEIPDARA